MCLASAHLFGTREVAKSKALVVLCKRTKSISKESNDPHLNETHQQKQPRQRLTGRHYRSASWLSTQENKTTLKELGNYEYTYLDGPAD